MEEKVLNYELAIIEFIEVLNNVIKNPIRENSNTGEYFVSYNKYEKTNELNNKIIYVYNYFCSYKDFKTNKLINSLRLRHESEIKNEELFLKKVFQEIIISTLFFKTNNLNVNSDIIRIINTQDLIRNGYIE